ncbi:cytochrome b [Thalassolituus sp. LLYu03]|uniref:cytochrome b n=1 Tax=Thalassolituus sp. LLYu03 TaxID=3421656 RepID=UPI003D2D01E8
MKQPADQYSLATKLLHWGSALVIFGLLAVGLIMEEMPKGPEKFELMGLHKSFGVLALILILVRIPVRISNPVAPLAGTPRGDVIKAKAVQGILYLLMLIMPLSGLLMSQAGGHPVAFFGLELPMLMDKNEDLHEFFEGVHGTAAWALIVVLVAHIGAALLHHFKMKDDTLKRMSLKG